MTERESAERTVQHGLLMGAFPAQLRADVAVVAEFIRPNMTTDPGALVVVQGERLHVPYRISHNNTLFSRLNETQSTIYTCVLTRHLDGHVRQRHVERLMTCPEAWIVPFVVHLCGEYVKEILDVVEAHLPALDSRVYGAFFRENPAFLKLAHDRMISYWDCYYRWLYKRKPDYVGFRIFERFDDWHANA